MEFNNRSLRQPIACIASTILLILVSSASWAAPITQTLTFSSEDQSMWDTGEAFQLDKIDPPEFYGVEWNESTSVGGFVGGVGSVLNPLWILWNICPIFCGDAPTKFLTVDTSTGLQVTAATQGKVGFELGLKIDSGSVDALVGYDVQFDVPETADITAGQFISLNAGSTLTGDSLETQFPTLEVSLGVVMEVSAQFGAAGCLLGVCDSTSFDTGVLGGTQELISFNKDGEGGINYFGDSGFLNDALDLLVASGVVDLPTGFPAEIEIPAPGLGNLATITAYLPEPNTSGGLDPTGTMLTSIGQDDLLDISIDVDNLLSIGLIGVGGLFGGSQDLGAGFSVSYDLINVEMGPQIDLVQSFEFTPTLMVDFEFSNPVNVTGFGEVTSVSGLNWDLLPTMAFGGGITSITPTYYLGTTIGGPLMKNAGELFNQLFLDIDGNVKVDLLTATLGTPFGDETIGIGNILDESFDLFSTPALFSRRFAMAGFDPIVGASFNVQVSEPGTLVLFGLGLILLGVARRRQTFTQNL